MMRKGIVVLVMALFSLAFVISASAAEKIASVDIGKLFDEYPKTKEFDKGLEQKAGAYEKDRDNRIAEIKQLQDKLSILTDQEKENKWISFWLLFANGFIFTNVYLYHLHLYYHQN